ncbi:MAG: hypothetical protein IJK89_04420 [Clostridia bacterium]|nr:hypothetical protein [Clostridia bacterium]
MQTISIGIMNLCAPCGCACRYCLLRSCKQAEGVDYERGKRLAERFFAWGRDKGLPEPPFYNVGFCAEYPQLLENIAFNRANGWIGARFLQCNGIAIRPEEETDRWLSRIKAAGIERIDTTFFGDRACHDAFAARDGDYDFMLLLASRAAAHGIVCAPTVPVTRENLAMLPELIDTLEAIPGIGPIGCFLPDHRGRGHLLEPYRVTPEDVAGLPEHVRALLDLRRYKTEAEWLADGPLPEYTKRALLITLRADNIDLFERMTCDEIVAYVEGLDDDYYRAIPPVNELAQMYGEPANRRLYRVRDLFWKWQRRYIKEHGLRLYDVTDERNCAAVRS